jgi:hypothetical protein
MGGKTILYALMLLALVGMVQADIITNLTQSVSPASGTQYGSASPTFTCYYVYYTNGTTGPVPGAFVLVLLDGKNYTATYSPNGVSNGYIYTGTTLYAGAHSWYCYAYAPGYQHQIGQTLTYTVLQQTGGGGGGGHPLRVEPTQQMPVGDTWTIAVIIVAILGLCIGYFILREALTVTVTRPRKKRK